eukprot:1629592-Rhodomonas_salina.1
MERLMHKQMEERRWNDMREFFSITKTQAVEFFKGMYEKMLYGGIPGCSSPSKDLSVIQDEYYFGEDQVWLKNYFENGGGWGTVKKLQQTVSDLQLQLQYAATSGE